MPNEKQVLVAGATGGQGGAVARSLLDRGWAVRALVRDPEKPASKQLEALGAELAEGDLDDPASLREAARGAHGVFSVQAADLLNPDPQTEIRQGRNLAEAAASADASHLVYSSVGAVGRGSSVSHFDTKEQIEAHIGSLDIPTTVLRPVFFMENWSYMLPQSENGERVGPFALGPDAPLQMIALEDVGRIAADVFASPDEFAGAVVEIAGDELTPTEIAEVFTRVDGVPTRFTHQPIEELRSFSEELAKMFAWLNETGYQADIPSLRERHPGLLNLETWRRRQR